MAGEIKGRRPYSYGTNRIKNVSSTSTYTKLKPTSCTLAVSSVRDPSGTYDAIQLATNAGATTTVQCLTFATSMSTASFRMSVQFYYVAGGAYPDYVYMENTTVSNALAYFNLSTGLKGTVGAGIKHASIRRVVGNWWNCTIEVQGTLATHTWRFGPCTADADRKVAASKIMDFYGAHIQSKARIMGASDAFSTVVLTDDEGALLMAGFDGVEANRVDVSACNITRNVNTKVVAVQHIDAAGTVAPSMSTSATAGFVKVTDGSHNLSVQVDGSAIEANGLAVGGTDGSNYQHFSVDSSGILSENLAKVAGTATDVSSGNKSSGTQRVTLATDDVNAAAIKTSVELIDDTVGTLGSTAPTKGVLVAGTDGTNARGVKVDSAGVVYNQPATVPTFEDTTNGRAIVSLENRGIYEAVTSGTALPSGVATTCLAWVKTLSYNKVEIWIDNVGGQALTALNIYASPDGTDANSQDVTAYQDTVEALSLTTASGECRLVISFDNPPTWVRVTATSAKASTVDCYLKARY